MTIERILICLTALFISFPTLAQEQTLRVGDKVENAEIRDSKNKPLMLPSFGKKHLLLFYPDPDNYKQNEEFTDYLEENQINSKNIDSYGIINMKDAPLFPNSIMRAVSRSKEKSTGARIYTDPNHLLRDAWGMGDINDQFVIVFVTKEGIVKFFKKGKMESDDITEFFNVIDEFK